MSDQRPSVQSVPTELASLIGKQVVVDTDSSYVYIGMLEAAGADFLTLTSVDVHDTAESNSTKEQYTHETLKLGGTRHNRKLTYLRLARVLSISALDDVHQF
ncbi:MAG TPA: hypothetical protein VEJ63_14160 [Planctomycetota bacterium]|nr:hypothetical protein [Planctomycetota bacterium]